MDKKLHIIYLPGFGGNYDTARQFFLRCWRIFGVNTEFIPMHWQSKESYDEKLARVTDAIDKAADKRVVVIGESAGGSMAVTAYAMRHRVLYKAMTICGKNNTTTDVAPELYTRHVTFREALQAAEVAATQLNNPTRHNFVSLYPIYDEVIPLKDTLIAGCRLVRLISIGHFFTIFLALTIFSGYIMHIAKQ